MRWLAIYLPLFTLLVSLATFLVAMWIAVALDRCLNGKVPLTLALRHPRTPPHKLRRQAQRRHERAR